MIRADRERLTHLILLTVISILFIVGIWWLYAERTVPTPEQIILTIHRNDDCCEVEPNQVILENTHLTVEQQHILDLAFKYGSYIGFPETIQAIAMQETHAGRFGKGIGDYHERVGERSYGIMQIKVVTARFVFTHHPNVFAHYFGDRQLLRVHDEEIIVLLLTNPEANIHLGTLNFELMLKFMNGSWNGALVAYNGGLGFARQYVQYYDPSHFKYVKNVRNWINYTIKPYNSLKHSS